MDAKPIVARLADLGSFGQSAAAGTYAWAVTVAPAAWAHGSGAAAKVAACAALAALAAAWWGGPRWGERARTATFWAFVLACALAWLAAPAALAPLRTDVFTGLTGTLAWALFAFTWAGPALGPMQGPGDAEDEPLVPRRRAVGREGYIVAMGGVAAIALQSLGWQAPGVERSLLVRAFGLAAGLAIVDASVDVARARYVRRVPLTASARLRAARTWLILLGAVALAVSVFALRG